MALRQNERLRQDIERLQGSIAPVSGPRGRPEEHAGATPKWPMTCAPTPRRKPSGMVKEAQGRAELMMMAAQNRVEDAQRDRRAARAALARPRPTSNRSSLSLNGTLEFIRDQQREPLGVWWGPCVLVPSPVGSPSVGGLVSVGGFRGWMGCGIWVGGFSLGP